MIRSGKIYSGAFAAVLTVALVGMLAGVAHGSGSPKTTTIGHHRHVNLARIAAGHGMKVARLSPDVVAIESGQGTVQFYPGHRKTMFGGIEIFLNGDLEQVGGDWFLTEVDRRDIIDPLLNPAGHLQGYECNLVVLDPGHGGADPGAVSPSGLYEKRLALDIAQRTAAILRGNDIEVHLTREQDKSLQLGFRPRIAQNRKADIFVSIHLNAAEAREARGVETYRLTASGFPSVENAGEAQFDPSSYNGNGYNGANTLLGFHIQKALHTVTKSPDRGLRHARYVVLKDAACPAVLVECGFLSNRQEEQLIAQPEYRQKIALGIASGIMQYRSAIGRAKLIADPIDDSLSVRE